MALPFSSTFSGIIKKLLAAGIKKKDIVLMFNKPLTALAEIGGIPDKCKYIITDDGEVACEIGKNKLLVSSYNELIIAWEIFINKCYDFNMPNADVVVVDIGMNIGVASIYFHTLENVKAIYSFEPFPDTFQRAMENFAINDISEERLFPHSFGVSNVTKELEVDYHGDLKGGMSTTRSIKEIAHYEEVSALLPSMSKINVQVVDIAEIFDAIIERHPSERFIFKIDCEGGEYEIFERLEETGQIAKIHMIMMEWHNYGDKNVSQIESVLTRNNFNYKVIGSREEPVGMIFVTNSL